jgi:hypothetical protein
VSAVPSFKNGAPPPDAGESMEKQQLEDEGALPLPHAFDLTVAPHGAFGALATLRLPHQPLRRFTAQEASIVARAIDAVAMGASPEMQIYMSPIASDHDFDARVAPDGLVIACAVGPQTRLSWPDAAALARALAAVGESGATP